MVTTRSGRKSLDSATPDSEAPKRPSSSTSIAQNLKTPIFSPTTTIVSPKPTSVFLEDWWLIKANGKDLVIGGFASRASLGVRLFSSAAISKRHCSTVLETTDGVTIILSGLINMSRTHQNGFPSQVCNQFLLGFPYNWEEYASCPGKESTDLGTSIKTSASDESNIFSGISGNNTLSSLNDLPVTTARDLLLSTFGNSNYDLLIKNIYNDTLKTSKNKTSENSGAPRDSNMESEKNSISNRKSGLNATAISRKKARTDSSHRHTTGVSVTRHRVSTRSMTRMQLRSR